MNSGQIIDLCNALLRDQGFECYPFLIGWYNSSITIDRYRLPYKDDTLALMVISIPRMFEITFLPWLRQRKQNLSDILDPIDGCMKDVFADFRQKLDPSLQMEIIHDFEMVQGRYPRVLMNTAGHVSGAAYYYQKTELNEQCLDKKLFSVSIHPKYGGWFAFRAVLVFPEISAPQLPKIECERRIFEKDEIQRLLHGFTYEWKKNEWRDACETVEEKYSPMQKEYFSRPPGERRELLKKWVDDGKI